MSSASFCRLVELHSQSEMRHLLDLCDQNIEQFDNSSGVAAHIGGIKSGDSWYGFQSGNVIDFDLEWGPGEPNSWNGNENCFGISLYREGFKLNDIMCYGEKASKYQFICQDITIIYPTIDANKTVQ
jgi:hypothetical protein